MHLRSQPSTLIIALLSSAALTACGGGGGAATSDAPSAPPAVASTAVSASPAAPAVVAPAQPPAAPVTVTAPVATPVNAPGTASVSTPPAVTAPVVAAPAPTATATAPTLSLTTVAPPTTLTPVQPPLGGPVTDVTFQSTSTVGQTDISQTFGQVFAVGHIPSGQTITGQLADGTSIPVQADIKARHADGSVRHAILTVRLPQLAAGASMTVRLVPALASAAPAPTSPQALLNAGFTTSVNLDIAGVRYTASPEAMLSSGNYKTWLSGNLSDEFLVNVPLTTAEGTVHPHLMARFAIRVVDGAPRARVDVTIENNWAFELAPQNVTYDAQILVGGQPVFTKAAMAHYHHARWRKVFWFGGEPQVHIKHNVGYLIGTRAVPNYDRSIAFTEAKLTDWKTRWTGTKVEPMGIGIVNPYMGATGGRDELGQMPAWYATYLLTMDKRVKDVTLASGDLAGSWSTHYRDKVTDRPVNIAQYPYMTTNINIQDTYNPVTKKFEAFPKCATTTSCTTPYSHDTSHQAAFAFVPYMVTGDYYYLEELQFWASFNGFASNPGYRQLSKGLFQSGQVRGQAWNLRTLGEAAYISPDNDIMKTYFTAQLQHNIDWYDANYTNNPNANSLGILTHANALAYADGTSMAPWMDDFFTSSIGRLVDLGYSQAKPLLNWKVKFTANRMTAPGTCWVSGAIYALKVRDSATSAVYTTMEQAYKASHTQAFAALSCGGAEMAASLKLRVGEMTGYSGAHTGYPSNMQPALAYAADVLGTPGSNAWATFMRRSIKPNYGLGPQFAVVPRTVP